MKRLTFKVYNVKEFLSAYGRSNDSYSCIIVEHCVNCGRVKITSHDYDIAYLDKDLPVVDVDSTNKILTLGVKEPFCGLCLMPFPIREEDVEKYFDFLCRAFEVVRPVVIVNECARRNTCAYIPERGYITISSVSDIAYYYRMLAFTICDHYKYSIGIKTLGEETYTVFPGIRYTEKDLDKSSDLAEVLYLFYKINDMEQAKQAIKAVIG